LGLREEEYEIEAGNFGYDELLISHDRAMVPIVVESSGSEELMISRFFRPDINLDIRSIPHAPQLLEVR
jgi:hypothetical protein